MQLEGDAPSKLDTRPENGPPASQYKAHMVMLQATATEAFTFQMTLTK